MLQPIFRILDRISPAPTAHAHCDGPCGVYDPASARIAAEAVQAMTKKLLALDCPDDSQSRERAAYLHTYARYMMIKEEQAEIAKRELLILWADYFKPEHLEHTPDLHATFWNAAKLCSKTKQEVNQEAADELIETVRKIGELFEKAKK